MHRQGQRQKVEGQREDEQLETLKKDTEAQRTKQTDIQTGAYNKKDRDSYIDIHSQTAKYFIQASTEDYRARQEGRQAAKQTDWNSEARLIGC